ncbi:J domain-containing protein [Dethiothermospora halolimnae]|uniref:J domain-containing protein n=1 Tax=Dethiothermospora halolimnae TaxID=3114390 RepID=UPI003CCBBB63
MENLYNILEVDKNATQNEIRRAYRKLAKKYHPDLNPDDENATRKFKEVKEAYEILKDESLRKKYDEGQNNTSYKGKRENTRKRKSKSNVKSQFNMNFQFEDYFGFDPKKGKMKKNSKKTSKKNPMDTSNIFNSFFGVKKD